MELTLWNRADASLKGTPNTSDKHVGAAKLIDQRRGFDSRRLHFFMPRRESKRAEAPAVKSDATQSGVAMPPPRRMADP